MEFGIQGKSHVLILEYDTKKPVLFLPEVFFTHLNLSGITVQSRGGEQGMNLIGWTSNADPRFLIHTPIFTMPLLELVSGSELSNKAAIVHEMEVLEVNQDNKVNLKFTPLTNKPVYIFSLNVSGRHIISEIQDYERDNKEIDFTGYFSEWVLVYYYHKPLLDILKIGKFINKGYYTLVGETILYNKNEMNTEKLKFEFPKIQIDYQIDLKMLNAKDPNQMFIIPCLALVEDASQKLLLKLMKQDIDEEVIGSG